MNTLATTFIEQSVYYLEQNTPRIISCLDDLTDDEIWFSPVQASNSIGNLVLHLCGNITQYVISALGETEDHREREKEFSVKHIYTGAMLIDKLRSTLSAAIDVIKNLDKTRLMKFYSVQGFHLSGVGIIIHVTEHYSYHTGQIAFFTKQLKNKEMGFYKGIDLNKKNN